MSAVVVALLRESFRQVPWPFTQRSLGLKWGDHLDRREFHRRYEAMPHLKKAELLDGVVYVPSPASLDHAGPYGIVVTWLGTYAAGTPGVQMVPEVTVILGPLDEVQPDALLRVTGPKGHTRRSEDGFIAGPPELIVEVALSSASYDLHTERHAYERSGVAEYIVWRTADEVVDWWALAGSSRDASVAADSAGLIQSRVFPGLVLDPHAALRADLAAVVETQRTALGSPLHRAFVESLADA